MSRNTTHDPVHQVYLFSYFYSSKQTKTILQPIDPTSISNDKYCVLPEGLDHSFFFFFYLPNTQLNTWPIVCVYVCLCVYVSNSVTPRTAAHRAPLSMGYSRQQYWSELPFPSPQDLPNPETEPLSLGFPALVFTASTTWEALVYIVWAEACLVTQSCLTLGTHGL